MTYEIKYEWYTNFCICLALHWHVSLPDSTDFDDSVIKEMKTITQAMCMSYHQNVKEGWSKSQLTVRK